jgi:hypothetical protein
MSQAAAQAQAFYREVAKTGKLWTVRDQGGFPQPMTNDGYRAQPFWSSLSRVQRIVKSVPAYAGCEPHEISWPDFRERWVPGLTTDRVRVGVNWSGPRAVGYDLLPQEILRNVEYRIQELHTSQ